MFVFRIILIIKHKINFAYKLRNYGKKQKKKKKKKKKKRVNIHRSTYYLTSFICIKIIVQYRGEPWYSGYTVYLTCETKAPVTPLSRVAPVSLVGEPLYQLDTQPFSCISLSL